jgi:ABC-type tungstate transport system permease subunit
MNLPFDDGESKPAKRRTTTTKSPKKTGQPAVKKSKTIEQQVVTVHEPDEPKKNDGDAGEITQTQTTTNEETLEDMIKDDPTIIEVLESISQDKLSQLSLGELEGFDLMELEVPKAEADAVTKTCNACEREFKTYIEGSMFCDKCAEIFV